MILKLIISHLNGKIDDLGYFTKVFDLCQLKEKGDKTSPMLYCGNGEYKEVFNLDYEKGLTYFRKRSDTVISPSENIVVGCENLNSVEYKLRLVAALKKFPDTITDDNYSADRIALTLFKNLQNSSDKTLKTLIKSRLAEVLIINYSTNTKDILKSEFIGFELKDLPDKYSFISMDIDVNATLSTECLTQECI